MSKEGNTRLRMLEIIDILKRKSDSGHPITVEEINKGLALKSLEADPRTIREDIEYMIQYGINIDVKRVGSPYYFRLLDSNRLFSLGELKVLIDCVQSSRFLSVGQSRNIIQKLERLTSERLANSFKNQVIITNRIKAYSSNVFDTISILHQACKENVKVSFLYWKWGWDKKRYYRNQGNRYVVSPYIMEYRNDYYYLVAYVDGKEKINNFRIDKIEDIRILSEKRVSNEQTKELKPELYSARQTNMFGGKICKVSLVCKKEMAGVFIDQYGSNLFMFPVDQDTFAVNITVAVSEQFYGWIVGLGDKVVITGPDHVLQEYTEHLQKVLDLYENNK